MQNHLVGLGVPAMPRRDFGNPGPYSLAPCLPEKPNRNPLATLAAEILHFKDWPLVARSRHLETESASQPETSSCPESADATSTLIGRFLNC